MTSALHYWLVGTKGSSSAGDEITGGASKIISSATKPTGYSTATDLGAVAGQTIKSLESSGTLAAALVSLPTGIRIENTYTVPGLGTINVHGPSGIAGALDQAATTTGNTAQDLQNFTSGQALAGIWSALTTPSNWLRALELAGGAVLVFMALKSLTGVNTPSLPKAVPVPA